MKCSLCEQRKSKRHCPAKNTLLCAQCCGEKRVLEINCPENCEFLLAGRERDAQEFGRHVRNLDAAARERSRRVLLENQDAVAYLEYAIAQARVLSRDLTDKDVVQAIDVLLETYRTEDKAFSMKRLPTRCAWSLCVANCARFLNLFGIPRGRKTRGSWIRRAHG